MNAEPEGTTDANRITMGPSALACGTDTEPGNKKAPTARRRTNRVFEWVMSSLQSLACKAEFTPASLDDTIPPLGVSGEGGSMALGNKVAAEFVGTFWLVFGGCGSAVLAAAYPDLGIGFLGVALAFGLTVMTMAYAVGHISGCHLNPAVSVGLLVGKRFPASEMVPYIIAQVLGGIAGAAVLYFIASGQDGFEAGGFASNGFGEHSPGGYSMAAALAAEIVLTFMFLFIILGATDKRAPAALAPVAIGLGLTLIHLIGIPVDNLSVNPARSTAVALFAEPWALQQLWLFWVAPIIGGAIGGVVYPLVAGSND
jgi:aquaporin Z